MRQYQITNRTYPGFSKYDADAPILVVTTFDGEPELWSMDSDIGLPNLLQLYLDYYGREPEDITLYTQYTKGKEYKILRSDGVFFEIKIDKYDGEIYRGFSPFINATKFNFDDAIKYLNQLKADYSNTGYGFTLVSF